MGSCKQCDGRVPHAGSRVKEVVKKKETVTDIDYVRDQVSRAALRNNNKNASPLVFEDNVPRQLRDKAVKRYFETVSASLELPNNYKWGQEIAISVASTALTAVVSSMLSIALGGGWIGGAIPTVLVAVILSIVDLCEAKSIAARRYKTPLTKDELKALKGNFHVRTYSPSKATALSVVAGEILDSIESSTAWNSKYLALERLQLNLDEEFMQVARVCRKLESAWEMIGSHKDSDFDDPALRDELKFRKTAYTEAYAVVERRVATLYTYYTSLVEVESVIKQLDAANSLRDTRSEFDDLLNEVALSELATAHVESLRVNLDALKENLEARLQFIRTNVVNNPYLDRPLALQS